MLGYRTVLTTDETEDSRGQILGVIQRWFTKKKRFPSMPTNGSVNGPNGATLSASDYAIDGSTGIRWELVEEWDAPPWDGLVSSTSTAVTHITIVSSGGELWLWVDIEPPTLTTTDADGRLREEPQYTGTPAFVSAILEAVEMRDGRAEPMSGFQTIPKASYVEQLIEVLEDDTRLGAVFVTAPPEGTSVDAWVKKSDDRSYAMQGLAVGYVLAGDALTAFNRHASPGHSVPAGGMRTFVPGADFDDINDAANHRLMLPSTLRDSDERRVRRILRSAQIRRLRSTRLPDELQKADYEFLRKRRMQPFEVLHREPAPGLPEAPKLEAPDELTAVVADLRGRLQDAEDLANEALLDIAKMQRERSEALDEAALNSLEAEESYLRYSRGERAADKLKAQIEHLRRQLIEAGAAGAAWSVPEELDDDYPATFAELIDRLGGLHEEGQLARVRFTGDRNEARELDEHSVLGEAAVAKTWDALLTFSAYSEMRSAGKFDQSLSHYAKYGGHGGLVRLGKVVWTEGEQVKTRGRFRQQRMLPVDPKVDPSGSKLMVAHVKLSNLTGIAPRMYFEDTHSLLGYVTVGYLGAHMDNPQTN